jgi:prephenate dehydratase
MSQYESQVKVSTLGPADTNSHHAAILFMKMKNLEGEPLLTRTAEESFDLLLEDKVTYCVVCNLYPDIHKLYIPHLKSVTACEVFIYHATMGLYKRPGVKEIESAAAPITSTVFLKDRSIKVIVATSNAEAVAMCCRGEVDAAIGTAEAVQGRNLEILEDFGTFNVPYTVFSKKN